VPTAFSSSRICASTPRAGGVCKGPSLLDKIAVQQRQVSAIVCAQYAEAFLNRGGQVRFEGKLKIASVYSRPIRRSRARNLAEVRIDS
jgi:hypothetical protein